MGTNLRFILSHYVAELSTKFTVNKGRLLTSTGLSIIFLSFATVDYIITIYVGVAVKVLIVV